MKILSCKFFCLTMMFLTFIYGCSPDNSEHINSAYYWTTAFRLTPLKRNFLADNHVRRLYVRFFDVVPDAAGQPVPNATIEFADTVPENLEVVPVVYVMNECMAQSADSLAEKIMLRVMKMCQTHDVPNVHEIQIDCDWTSRTQQQYFDFLNKLRGLLAPQEISLSTTIRLHQLAMDPPPADRGILMVYNTGDVTDRACPNPILHIDQVRPFMKHLNSYSLPLSAAYPIFSWEVIFRGDRFVGISHYEGEWITIKGDTVVTYSPTTEEVAEVKRLVERTRPDANRETILFDLSDKNLQHQSPARLYR